MDLHEPSAPPQFFCDAMLGGLARWLRAAGYDALFVHGIDDGDLVAQAGTLGRWVLSSDRPLFERRPMRDGSVQGLFVPRHAPVLEQTAFVLRSLSLPLCDPRCMVCSGVLTETPPGGLAGRVPERTLAAYDVFWSCSGCERVYWRGAHWERIIEARRSIDERMKRLAPPG